MSGCCVLGILPSTESTIQFVSEAGTVRSCFLRTVLPVETFCARLHQTCVCVCVCSHTYKVAFCLCVLFYSIGVYFGRVCVVWSLHILLSVGAYLPVRLRLSVAAPSAVSQCQCLCISASVCLHSFINKLCPLLFFRIYSCCFFLRVCSTRILICFVCFEREVSPIVYLTSVFRTSWLALFCFHWHPSKKGEDKRKSRTSDRISAGLGDCGDWFSLVSQQKKEEACGV